MSGSEDIIYRYWGKADKNASFDDDLSYHPAICHMLDTGLVAQALLNHSSHAFLNFFLQHLYCSDNEKIAWISFIVTLHDIGKISPGFQAKRMDLINNLIDESYPFLSDFDETDHGRITFMALPAIFEQATNCSRITAIEISRAIGGHHGEFHQNQSPQHRKSPGKGKWEEARNLIVKKLAQEFSLNWDTFPFKDEENISASFLMILAGLTSVADWVGSNKHLFNYVGSSLINLHAYFEDRRSLAKHAVQSINLDHPPIAPGKSNFNSIFPFDPNPCQKEILQIARKLKAPSLIVVETPTGSGKTEAALAVADILLREKGASGLYYALPTQATGNKMFDRVKEFISNNPACHDAELHLLHGYADLHKGYSELKLTAIDGNEKDSSVTASSWFCSKKRALISPFAVGTIDQALLAVLQARHMFVRLYGLAGKVIVIDEVHAYDTYTSTLLDRLLEWLSSMDTNVILLSATLPIKRRTELIKAYAPDTKPLEDKQYPVILGVNRHGQCERKSIVGLPSRSFRLELIREKGERRWKKISDLLSTTLHDGGCAACIMNTVDEAQELFSYLKFNLRFDDENLFLLFHARFPMGQRMKIETEIDGFFGKGNTEEPNIHRPHRAIVVSTQVLEQSLDVDFDIMITDIAPIDLILQRAGRLQRHEKNYRPTSLKDATLYCLQADLTNSEPKFGATEFIYERGILLKTALALEEYSGVEIMLPDSVECLIEKVYGGEEVFCPEHLSVTLEDWLFESSMTNREIKFMGRSVVLPSPSSNSDDSDILGDLAHSLRDDDLLPPNVKSQTRLARPSIKIIVLHQLGDAISFGGNTLTEILLNTEPDANLTRKLLEQSIQISNPEWFEFFKSQDVPPGWKKSPLLRYCRAAIFQDRAIKKGLNELRIDNELGLVIFSKKKRGR